MCVHCDAVAYNITTGGKEAKINKAVSLVKDLMVKFKIKTCKQIMLTVW